MRRYIQLFFMLAISSLVTMGIQALLSIWLPMEYFWTQYVSFVLIFFVLLSLVLHFATVKKYKNKKKR